MKETDSKKWYLVDATGQILGRLASKVAQILIGKGKTNYAPNKDAGDYVVIINAEEIKVTGGKMEKKNYYRHSGYPGGLKKTALKKMMAKNPTLPLKKAIWGMMPHNRLGREMFKKLKVYKGPEHPHKERKLEELKFRK